VVALSAAAAGCAIEAVDSEADEELGEVQDDLTGISKDVTHPGDTHEQGEGDDPHPEPWRMQAAAPAPGSPDPDPYGPEADTRTSTVSRDTR